MLRARASLPAVTWSASAAVLDRVRDAAGEEWTSQTEHRTPAFVKLLHLAKDHAYVVSGELSPDFFGQPKVLKEIASKLQQGVRIELLFYKPFAHSAEEAQETVCAENPGIAELKRKYPLFLRLFWVPRRPRLQFSVVDTRHTAHEEPDHKTGTRPATVNRYQDRQWAREWEENFRAVRDGEAQEILGG